MFGAKTQIAAHQKSLGAELLIDDAATGRMRQVRNEQARPSFAHHPHQRGQGGSMADITKITSGTLIAAEKVEGTNVYNLQGDKLGTVDDIMIDKVSGRAIYALMSFGGFLGMGEKYHPLPWSALKYDESKGGYVVNLDKKMLENAPTYDMEGDFQWTPDYGRQVDKYYDAPTYW
jgi:hypothetical protein